MKTLVILVFLSAFARGQVEIEKRFLEAKSYAEVFGGKKIEVDPRIIGGNPVQRGDVPYFAMMFLTNSLNNYVTIGGGSLIKHDWVLTNAALVSSPFIETHVYLGIVQRPSDIALTPGFAQWYSNKLTNSSYYPHPQFDTRDFSNNIGLLKIPLTEVIYLTLGQVKTIPLPRWEDRSNELVGFPDGRTSGFGLLENGSFSLQLREIRDLEVISNSQCSNDLSAVLVNKNVLCTKNPGNKSICAGDEGGPFTVTLSAERRLVGVVSFSISQPGCIFGFPSAYMRVTNYLQWIEDNVGEGIIPGNSAPTLIRINIALSIAALLTVLMK